MKRSLCLALVVAALALALPAGALAGTLTLHPSGFGQHSYAAWKAQQGLPDSRGRDNQALYFQKMTTTPTFAAGVAVVKGISGLPATDLTGLSWDHREDGHCGAGAPRWNVNLRDATGNNYTVFVGCYASGHLEDGTGSGHGWCHDEPNVGAEIVAQTGQALTTLTVTGLAIVFDEGTDTANPPPAGCDQEQFDGGFVHLDNLEVATSNPAYPTKCWTGANDNSNSSTGPCADPPDDPDGTIGVPSTLVGLPVDPANLELVAALALAYPDVALPEWSLYPYMY